MATIIPGVYPRPGVTGKDGQPVIGKRPTRTHSVAVWVDSAGTRLTDSGVLIDVHDNLTVPGRVNGRVIQTDGTLLDSLAALAPYIPSSDEKDALAGNGGGDPPSAANPYVLDDDPRLTGGGGGGGINPPAGQIGGNTASPTILGIRETSGPTLLTFSAIADLQFFQRSGTSIIGVSAPFVNEGVTTTATDLAVTAGTTYVAVTSTAATRTITLPLLSSVSSGYRIVIADESGLAGNPNRIIIAANGVEPINGTASSTRAINRPYKSIIVIKRGTSWWVLEETSEPEINVLDFGADPTGVADSLAAFTAATATAAISNRYVKLIIPSGQYLLSDTWVIDRPVNVEGAGNNFTRATTLLAPLGRDIIRVNYQGGPVAGGGGGSKLSSFKIEHTVGIGEWQANTSYVANVSCVTRVGHTFGVTFFCTGSGLSGSSEPTWNETEGGTTTDGAATWTTVYQTGIKLYAPAHVKNVFASGCGGDGFSVFASTGDGNNANGFSFESCSATSNAGWGYFTQGADSNAGTFTNCSALENSYGGYCDNSFLGNTYLGCEAENNAIYAYQVPSAQPVNSSAFIGCYTESGQLNDINGTASWVGNGRGALTYGTGMILDPDRSNTLTFLNDTNNDGTGDGAQIRIGRMFTQAIMEFAFSQDSYNLTQFGYGAVNGAGNVGWVSMGGSTLSAWAISLTNSSAGVGNMWIPNDLHRGTNGINTVERFVGGTDPDTYINDTLMARGVIREGSNQVSGAYAFMRVDAITSANGWGIIRPHHARTVAANTTLDVRNWYVEVSAVPHTITLPSTGGGVRVDNGYDILIRDTSGSASIANPITIAAGGSELINGAASITITDANGWAWLVRYNGGWRSMSGGGGVPTSLNLNGTIVTLDGVVNNNQALRRSGTQIVGYNYVEGSGTYPNLPYWSNGGGGVQLGDSGIPYTALSQNIRTVTAASTGTLANTDSNTTYHNTAAGGNINVTAPASTTTGFHVRFRVGSANELKFTLQSGQTAYGGPLTSTSGGSVAASTIGAGWDMEYVGSNTWFISNITGTVTAA